MFRTDDKYKDVARDLGIFRPTTPETTGPEWHPILMKIDSPLEGSFSIEIPSIMSKAMSQI